jgi:hypothetical protein
VCQERGIVGGLLRANHMPHVQFNVLPSPLSASPSASQLRSVDVFTSDGVDAALGVCMDVLRRRDIVPDDSRTDDEAAEREAKESDEGVGPCNAFSITLYCVDEMFESRSQDFLHHGEARECRRRALRRFSMTD